MSLYDDEEFDYLHQCAIKIQKNFRGYLARQFYQQLKQLIYYHYYQSQEISQDLNQGGEQYDCEYADKNLADEYGFNYQRNTPKIHQQERYQLNTVNSQSHISQTPSQIESSSKKKKKKSQDQQKRQDSKGHINSEANKNKPKLVEQDQY